VEWSYQLDQNVSLNRLLYTNVPYPYGPECFQLIQWLDTNSTQLNNKFQFLILIYTQN